MALHTLNNTVAKGFNQMAPPALTITVALDMSKSFNTVNIHTLIRKLLQTNILDTIIKFIANYIKGLEYASSVWSPITSSTSINKLQVMQNAALGTATKYTQDTNIQHLHDEKHSHSPYTSTYSSTPHNTNRKHIIHHIPYTNTQHTSTLQG